MAVLLTPGNKLRVTIACRTDTGHNGLMVAKYDVKAVGGAGATDQFLADQLSPLFATAMKAIMPSTAFYYGLKIEHLDVLPAASVVSYVGNGAGTKAGDLLPQQTAAVITKRTAKAGRRWRGRTYIPFLSEAYCDANAKPTAALSADTATLRSYFSSDVVITVGPDTVTVRNIIANANIPVGLFEYVLTADLRSQFGTQRRRSQINRADLVPF